MRRKPEAGGDYDVSLIELDEGVRMLSRVEGVPPTEVKIFACEELGRLAEAIEHFELALRLNPGFVDARRNLEIARQARRGRP